MDCNSCWCDSGVAVCTKKYCMSVSSRSANQISSDRDCTREMKFILMPLLSKELMTVMTDLCKLN